MGEKQARILLSEAEKLEKINSAAGESEAVILIAKGQAQSINLVSNSLKQEQGHNSASLSIARQYVHAFSLLATKSNTLILPVNPSDVVSIVSQAMSIYNQLSTGPKNNTEHMTENKSNTTETDYKSSSINPNKHVKFDPNFELDHLSIYSSPTIKA